MASLDQSRRRSSAVPTALAAIIGVPIGLFGSIFGSYFAIAVGVILVIVGAIGAAGGTRWNRVLLIFGAAVIIGAALYFLVGILTPDGASSGFGSGCATGGACE